MLVIPIKQETLYIMKHPTPFKIPTHKKIYINQKKKILKLSLNWIMKSVIRSLGVYIKLT